MRLTGFSIVLFAFACTSCKNNQDKASSKVAEKDTTKFFQITQYLQSQIKEVNATPFFIYKIDIYNNKQDSTPINAAIFTQVSSQFLTPDINDEKIKHYYTESIFEDQTTKSFTISYSTTNKELELQNVDVLLDEDGQTVKRIHLRKYRNYPDSSAIEQLSWKPGESFQVNKSVQLTGNTATSHQTIVVWNKKG